MSRKRKRLAKRSEVYNVAVWAVLVVACLVLVLALYTAYWRPASPTKIIDPVTRSK